eukprot:gene21635-27675_t
MDNSPVYNPSKSPESVREKNDQDELDERLDRLQKATLKSITSCTGLTKEQQKIQGDVTIDALKYLQRSEDQYSSDEEGEEEEVQEGKDRQPEEVEPSGENVAVRASPKEAAKAVIMLSDSEDDSDNEEEEEEEAQEREMMEVQAVKKAIVPAAAKVPAATSGRAVSELDMRREAYLAKLNRPKSARAALLISLRHKVLETADSTYCKDHNIQSVNLGVILQISEKSRMLVDLLKERQALRSEADRESRRVRYQTNASAEDDEFDEDDEEAGFGEGAFMSDEVREALIRQLNGEADEEEEEEENNDEWQQGDEGDDERHMEGSDAEEEEEDQDGQKVKEEEKEGVAVELDNGEEEEEALQTTRVRGGGRNVVREEVDEEEEGDSLSAADSASQLQARPLVQYGRVRPAPVAASAEDEDASTAADEVRGAEEGERRLVKGEGEENILDEEEEVVE